MNTKAKALILSTSDYSDADKLASVFCYELGKITVKFNGVKKQNAKLKNCCQPFCLCDMEINKKGTHNIVTSASIIDTNFKVLSDYDKTTCAYIVTDIIKTIVPTQLPAEDIFIFAVQALANIGSGNAFVALKDFVLNFLTAQGMQLDTALDSKVIFLDKYEGIFTNQKSESCVQIDNSVYRFLSSDTEVSRRVMVAGCKLLHKIIAIKYETEIKAFAMLE